jgi:hypothetical protein
VRKLIALLAVASLSGCVAYGVPYGSADVYYGSAPYYGGGYYYDQPTYIYGGGYYRHRQYRDSDRDGIPNWRDRDRDGDGVPNRRDTYPRNPRRQ